MFSHSLPTSLKCSKLLLSPENLSESHGTIALHKPLMPLGVKERRRELVDAKRRALRWELPAFPSSLSYARKFSMGESTGEHRRWLRLKALAGTPQEAPPDKDPPTTKGYTLDCPWQGLVGMSGRKGLD